MYEIVNISINYGLEKEKINRIINVYNQNRSNPADIADVYSTDTIFRILSINTAEAQSTHQKNTYMYLFTYKSPFNNGKLGTPHAMEIPFVFGTLNEFRLEFYPESNPETTSLSGKIMDCWISFARAGNPNHNGIPNWPKYDKNTRATMIFDKTVKLENDPYGEERAAWDNIY